MNQLSGYVFSSLREGDIALYRGSGNGLTPILLVAAGDTSPGCVERLEHEYALKSELDADWAARPVALTHENGRTTLVLEDPGGTPLDRLLGRPLDISHFLRVAIPLAGALGHVHERGLIHKDIKPANISGDRFKSFSGRLSVPLIGRTFSLWWRSNDKLRGERDPGVNGICDEALGFDAFHGFAGRLEFGFALEGDEGSDRDFGDLVLPLDVLEQAFGVAFISDRGQASGVSEREDDGARRLP
jgi:hypothetical protein